MIKRRGIIIIVLFWPGVKRVKQITAAHNTLLTFLIFFHQVLFDFKKPLVVGAGDLDDPYCLTPADMCIPFHLHLQTLHLGFSCHGESDDASDVISRKKGILRVGSFISQLQVFNWSHAG